MASFQKMFCGRKRGSEVWKYFSYNEQKRKSTCVVALADGRLCNASVASKNPTNLKNHLKSHHAAQFEEIIDYEAEQTEAKKKRHSCFGSEVAQIHTAC
jgi:hypothetical protein